MKLKVSDVGEKRLVSYILSKCSTVVPDDCGITSLDNDSKLVSTTDMLIQSHHFPDFMSYYDMGFKAVTANVSDIAAMGAKPIGFLLSIGLPKDLIFDDFKEILEGVLAACKLYDAPLIGGDTNEADEIIISGTALGTVKNPVIKNTYNPGNLIAVTGDIGVQALNFYEKLYFPPIARVDEGLILNGIATAMTDITDGLGSELYEMFNSENGFTIYEDKLKISDEFKKRANELNLNYLDLILYFGEDFELLFTFPESEEKRLREKLDFNVIGKVTENKDIEIVLANGKRRKIESKGYNHFKGEDNDEV